MDVSDFVDLLGRKIEVDDDIVVAVPHGRNSGASLVVGKIIKFTPGFVHYVGPDYTGHVKRERRVSPRKVIKAPVAVIKG
jgi:hypothetical protein